MAGRGRKAAVALAVLAVFWAVAAGGARAATPQAGTPSPYQPAGDAKKVRGKGNNVDGPVLHPGGIYTDTLRKGQKLYYTVPLDAKSDVYLSAVAFPKPGTKVSSEDGIALTLTTADATDCDSDDPTAEFGDEDTSWPLGDYVTRMINSDGECQQAGSYTFAIEREDGSSAAAWPIEIRYMAEPPVKGGRPDQGPPEDDSTTVTPPQPTSAPQTRHGGTGFNDARALEAGSWKDSIAPGETRFYRIPIDWGQQLFTSISVANSPVTKEGGDSSDGVRYDFYNTARGHVTGDYSDYDGDQTEVSFSTARVAYANRASDEGPEVARMRFSGWYYLAVTMQKDVGNFTKGRIPMKIEVTLKGSRQAGPVYRGDAAKAGFGLTSDDFDAARKGETAAQTAGSDALHRVVGFAGIGAGTVLLLTLAVWTLVARRHPADGAPAPGPGGFGPPPAW